MNTRRKIAVSLLVSLAVFTVLSGAVIVVTYQSARRIAAVNFAGTNGWSFIDNPVYVSTRLSCGKVNGEYRSWLPYWVVTYACANDKRISTCCFIGLDEILANRGPHYGDPWQYHGAFHAAIRNADRIVVRDGGFDCCGAVDDDPVLFEVVDPQSVAEVFTNLQFKRDQIVTACLCCGGPGIDWYRGNRRLALTACQESALRWRGFPGPLYRSFSGRRSSYSDAKLTEESSRWFKNWLDAHSKKGGQDVDRNPQVTQ